MQNALEDIDAIVERVRGRTMLLLDFDGTLAPIVEDPASALPSEKTRSLVSACVARFPVAIVTGRALFDITQRIPIDGLWYSGSHGLEWQVGTEVSQKFAPAEQRAAMEAARKVLEDLAAKSSNTIFEDKVHCAGINYRALSADDAREFSERAYAAVAPFVSAGLKVMDGMRSFEVLPAIDWTKGECSRMLVRMASDKAGIPLVPIYIGDAITDEDAFRALEDGVTIRVGESAESLAHYYLPDRAAVDALLERLSVS